MGMGRLWGVASLLLLATLASAAVPEDEVKSLPGWDGPLPSRQYSGYIKAGPGKAYNIHYWFVECEGPNPEEAPVNIWWQGGPGGSAVYGYFVENGPFLINDLSIVKGNSLPQLIRNPYSWAKFAHYLIFETPGSVGYSYCDSGPCPVWNDTNIADLNLELLQSWYKLYPEYAPKPLFMTGESYAGVTVPTLVDLILNSNEEVAKGQSDAMAIDFKGYILGDACMGIKSTGGCAVDAMYWHLLFLNQRGQMSPQLWAKVQTICGDETKTLKYQKNPECIRLIEQELAPAVGSYNIYNLEDDCYEFKDTLLTKLGRHGSLMDAVASGKRERAQAQPTYPTGTRMGLQYECGGDRIMNLYLNFPEVKKALHVDPSVRWCEGCRGKYVQSYAFIAPLVEKFLAKGLRIWYYSGDSDPAIPWEQTAWWMNGGLVNYTVKEPWRTWGANPANPMVVGGHLTTYDTPAPGSSFAHATVRNSGHMVPLFKPLPALTLVSSFLANKTLPPFTWKKPCIPPLCWEHINGTTTGSS